MVDLESKLKFYNIVHLTGFSLRIVWNRNKILVNHDRICQRQTSGYKEVSKETFYCRTYLGNPTANRIFLNWTLSLLWFFKCTEIYVYLKRYKICTIQILPQEKTTCAYSTSF
jgi:hypothetical protein